jgi:hypothetical protein
MPPLRWVPVCNVHPEVNYLTGKLYIGAGSTSSHLPTQRAYVQLLVSKFQQLRPPGGQINHLRYNRGSERQRLIMHPSHRGLLPCTWVRRHACICGSGSSDVTPPSRAMFMTLRSYQCFLEHAESQYLTSRQSEHVRRASSAPHKSHIRSFFM